MKYYISLLALGDNLISLSLLEQLDDKVKILGTKHTQNIAKLMGVEDKLIIEVVFDDIPAFYNIKKMGVFKAIKDFYSFIRYIKSNSIDELIFEKKDFRSELISLLTGVKMYYPDILSPKVYENRKDLISNIYNKSIELNNYKLLLDNPKIILINPLTREEYRNIKYEHLKYMLEEFNKYGYKVYLIDIEKKYSEFQDEVKYYLTNTTLDDVKKLIIKSDIYIGGDSFLIHLAYYLKRNYFMFFYRDNDDFLPPNIENNFYIKAHHSDDIEKELNDKFKNIGLIR